MLREKSKFRKEIKYFFYNKLGHMKKECKKFKREQSIETSEEKKEEKDIATITSDIDVVIIYNDDFINLICHDCT